MDGDRNFEFRAEEPLTLFVFGASGYGRAMRHALETGFRPARLCKVAGFVDDDEGGKGIELDGLPVLSFEEWHRAARAVPIIVSVGSPGARLRITGRLADAGASFAQPYRRLPESTFPAVRIGAGTFIGPYSYIGPITTIGVHTQIMSACSIGHDVDIADFCTICPSCTVSGHVVLEPGVFLGAGTTIVNGRPGAPIRVGRDAKIAAGSVVTKSVPAGAKIAGNPARPLREVAEERLRATS